MDNDFKVEKENNLKSTLSYRGVIIAIVVNASIIMTPESLILNKMSVKQVGVVTSEVAKMVADQLNFINNNYN